MRDPRAYTDAQMARMADLNLRAEKVGYKVHFPRREEHWGWFNIVDLKLDEFEYDNCIVRTCEVLDEVEAFIVEREKGSGRRILTLIELPAFLAAFAARDANR
jgi:hypothetical protein